MKLPSAADPSSPGKRRDTADLHIIENNQRIQAHEYRAPLTLDLDNTSDSEYTYQDESREKLLQPEVVKFTFSNQKGSTPSKI